MFQLCMVKIDQSESFCEVFGIDLVVIVSGFFLLFENIEYTLTVFLEKYEKYDNYNSDYES